MAQASVAVDYAVFDVEKNTQFALQLFNAYYRTPDPSGKIYVSFPEFLLIKPEVLGDEGLVIHSQEKAMLAACQAKARARRGWVGISKYFDEKFGYHWIKVSAYPFMLGDVVDEKSSEFFYILSKFIEFTKNNPDVYGDLTAGSETDNDIAIMLNGIQKNAEQLGNKLSHYSEAMLVSFNPDWPADAVKKLLVALENDEHDWNQLFLEHLRFVLRKKFGLPAARKVSQQNSLVSEIRSEPVVVAAKSESSMSPIPSNVAAAEPVAHTPFVPFSAIVEATTKQPVMSYKSPGNQLEVTQRNPVFDANAMQHDQSVHEQQTSTALNSASARAAKVAQIKAEATSAALKAQEEQIRLEALAVVALRKQTADAELAGQAARERIEQIKQAHLLEEAKALELEHASLESEEAATLIARQRAELAERTRQEAEQTRLLEMELTEREQASLDQERELQLQISARLAAVEQAALAMQARLQSELEAQQLAEEQAAAEQAARLRAQVIAQQLEQSKQNRISEEVKAQELERAHLHSETLAITAARQRTELAERTVQEVEQTRLLEMELAAREQAFLDQERELQLQITARLSLVEQAHQELQDRIQSEHEAAHLAQAQLEEEQAAMLHIQEKIRQLERDKLARISTEAQAQVSGHAHRDESNPLLMFQEQEGRYSSSSSIPSVDDAHRLDSDEFHADDAAHDHGYNRALVQDEPLAASRAQADAASSEDWLQHGGLSMPARSGYFQGKRGWMSVVGVAAGLLLAYFIWAMNQPDSVVVAKLESSGTAISPPMKAIPDVAASGIADVEIREPFARLKIAEHLQVIPAH